MSTVEVLVQGIIMFVASSVYGGSGTDTGGALAINTPAPRPGSYGVELPVHEPRLSVPKDALGGSCSGRFVAAGSNCELVLSGDLIRLGSFSAGKCDALSGTGATGDLAKDGVADVSKLGLPTTYLRVSAIPNGRDYSKMDPALVASWLEIPTGTLTVPSHMPGEAEFRPSLYRYRPAEKVSWVTEVNAPCLLIKPFSGGSETSVQLSGTDITIDYRNMPQAPAHAGHKHGRRGVSYDFELLYEVLNTKPTIPPVPHHLRERPARTAPADVQLDYVTKCVDECIRNTVDAITGENCGPGTNPRPKP